jgi:small-conductance mechanosensitive channel
VAGAILASSAVLAIVVGFAAQRTLGNFIAGLSIAFTQPIRLGDEVQIGGADGIVEEIGLTYTWLRTRDNDMLVIPNEKLASDSLLNRTIRSAGMLAEVKVEVPLTADIRAIVSALEHDDSEVYVTELGAAATVAVRRQVAPGRSLDREESELRVAVHERLAELGALPVAE